ncbi:MULTISPECIES: GGDEF domain-containing protein [Alishewanella]|uniref:Diguanylate cyclase n=1 Tax=Alishewanella aestuarii B11 TaxID=1197174 RepID=J1QKJ8_9ALTE|nr:MULTISPECIES: GGDEF domain-containing protein [Alishewanella]EJI86116.1 diguanylate cyclase [Alishewanella aestuarii B11]OCW95388.1 diguanylate cyclase [Alishewanella sp. HH-ZS]
MDMAWYQVVHIAGSALYLLLLLLFLICSRVPRTNPGAGFWALALAAMCLARLQLLLSLPALLFIDTFVWYAGFIILEKIFLIHGLKRFLQLPLPTVVFVGPASLLFGLLVLFSLLQRPQLGPMIIFALFNLGCLSYVAYSCFQHRQAVPKQALLFTSGIALVLALHWATFPFVLTLSWWRVLGFVLGTILTMALYLSLLLAVFALFYQRLSDAESQALELAYQDPLTGLNNKRYMDMLFDKALLLATRPHQFVAIYYIDLDNFKPINDLYGHQTGDKVLLEVANRLRRSVRSTDICARIGGDEFVVIATQLDQSEQLHKLADKLLTILKQPVELGNKVYQLGASIGVSICPAQGTSLAELLAHADQAMYQVKQHGKSGYSVYTVTKQMENATAANGDAAVSMKTEL